MEQLIYFTAKWCAPCRVVSKSLEKIAEEYPNLDIQKVDVDENHLVAAEYGVRGMPTLVYLKDGLEIARIVGARTKDDIIADLGL